MAARSKFFDRFHSEHPHRIRYDRLSAEEKAEVTELAKVETGAHRVRLVNQLVQPRIPWKRLYQEENPDGYEELLERNPPERVRFVEIS